MKRVFSFFVRRWFVSLLGVTALSLIIWFVGPLVAIAGSTPLESEFIRWIVIAMVIALWSTRLAFNKIKSVLANRQLTAGITQSVADSSPDYGAEEVAQLKTRFAEAIEVLNQSPRGKGRKAATLYDLPWYVIIGPPGSGKTTALVNSGLEFPLADRFGDQALQGVGGTRNCDWWFSDSAVLLDTAGRYVTQDSQAKVDSAAWMGFLDLLKKYRRRRPINGVLVAISISDLMIQNEYERKLHVTAIKQRIHELYQHFEMRFPVYVLLTKCDLIAGFTEFFDDLRREERKQVWGMTFALEEQVSGTALERVGPEFDGLLQRINERLVSRLSQERDNHRRTLIYGFPQQLASLKESLDLFLKDIFRPSRFDEPVMLRGVYFTSGTQEGTPIDRVMGSLARSFGLKQQSLPSFGGQNRAYFITDLLKKVVIPEAQIAGTNLRLERRRIGLQNGAYAVAAGLTALAVVAWVVSYKQNQSYIEAVSKQVAEAQASVAALTASHRDPLLVLPPLNRVRAMTTGLDANESVPWSMGFGLYQGKRLGAKARAAYQRLLNTVFLPRLMLRLEEQLNAGADHPDYLFEGLKVYLMLREQAQFDAATILTWISLDWDKNPPRDFTEAHLQQMNEHLQTLLAAGPPVLPMALDEPLIAAVRARLRRIPLAERAYSRLKRANLGSNETPAFRITEAGGVDTPVVLSRRSGQPLNAGIDGFFTYAGFHEHFFPQSQVLSRELAAERWIVGEEADLKRDAQALLNEEVQQLYQKEYIDRWEALLADVQLVPVANISRGVEVLNVLSGANSPLRQFLVAVAKETALTRTFVDESGLMSQAADRVDSLKKRLTSVIGIGKTQGVVAEFSEKPGQLVENHFAALNKLVAAREDGTMPIDDILMSLNELYVYLDSIANAVDRGQAAMDAVKGNDALSNIVQKLQLKAKRQPALVGSLMTAAATSSKSLTIGGVREHLNAMWQSKPLPFCRRAINNRYPVTRYAAQEITLDDFGRFFGPAGVMNNFYNDYLAEFVDTTAVPWQWRGVGGIKPGVLAQFRRADVIRETFFQSAGPLPSVRFELKPINMDRNITRFLLNLDGQKVTYSHGPVRLTPLQWPGPGGTNQVQIQLLPALNGVPSSVRELGQWAWFRVLDSANVKSTSRPERYNVTFDVGGRKARYELHASSTYNPFHLSELLKFRCPEKL